jgi:tocopherol cyclase
MFGSNFFRGIFHPEAFHGEGKTSDFFEGWYVKLVSADQKQRWAVIPGVFLGQDGGKRSEAFIQVLDGSSGRSWYHRFELNEFEAANDRFEVRIGNNHFSAAGATLDLPQLKGTVTFDTAFDPWPVKPLSPGIMGWFGAVPFMECFHGIVSFGHDLGGALQVEGKTASFAGGRGYIETDWGKAFPSGYVWLHSNHIDTNPDASLIGSVAIIPWIGKPFRGFIVGLKHSGKLHRWTTYNGAKELELVITDSHVSWRLESPDGVLELSADRVRGGLLHAPIRTEMHQRVDETLDAVIRTKHTDKNGVVLLEGNGMVGAMEVYGDLQRLLDI